MIRVVVAEDQAVVRWGFRTLVDAEPDMTCVGEAADGIEAVALVARERPDVVLMDIRMPRVDGIEATRQVVALGARVLVLTTFDLDEHVVPALQAGAGGFLVKHTEPAELLRGIRLVAGGQGLLSPDVTRRLIAHVAGGGTPGADETADLTRPPLSLLTPRETEAVRDVSRGRSNTEIAQDWWVSEATVRTHVSRAMAKLGARDRAHLVVLAFELGLAAAPRRPS